QFDLEVKFRLWRDALTAFLSVAELIRNDKFADTADLHSHQPFVPALDYFSSADGHLVRLARLLVTVELPAVLVRAGVVNLDHVPGTGRRPVADLLVQVLQPGRGRDPLLLFDVSLVLVLVVFLLDRGRRCQRTKRNGNGARRQDTRH